MLAKTLTFTALACLFLALAEEPSLPAIALAGGMAAVGVWLMWDED